MPTPTLSPVFLRVTLANFFFFMNFASFFLLPLYIKELGGDESTVGLVMGTTGGTSLLFIPLVGLWIDRYGRRLFLYIGAVGMTVAALSFSQVDSVGPLLYLLRVLQGFSFACGFTATTTFAADHAPIGQRARALGLFGLSTLLTHAVAPGLGEEIAHRFGFPTLFVIVAAYSVVALLLAAGLPTGAVTRPAGTIVTAEPTSPQQWLVAAVTAFAAMGFSTVMTFIATFIRSADLGRAGYFFAAYTVTAVLVRFIGAGASDRLGRRRVIGPALLLLGGSIAMMSAATSIPFLAAAGMLFGASQGISYPTLHALMVDISAAQQMGRSQALFNGAFNFGGTAGAFLSGFVAESYGYRVMFIAAAFMPVAGSVLLLAGSRTNRATPAT